MAWYGLDKLDPTVAVTIVTYNSARFIRRCFESVFAQDHPRLELIVVDNASTDDTDRILSEFRDRACIVHNSRNIGFAAGQNQAIAQTRADWVLTLNPDVRMWPNFVSMLVAAGEADSRVGSVCGKLLRMSADFQPSTPPVFDSTGIYFTPALRHLDRGSGERDDSRYAEFEYVFGASAAAALYRREMIDDISVLGEFFDTDFFAYREDADVAWRAQLLGWKCLYTPLAVGYHLRTVHPENRASVAPELNMHSVKNRWLMRIKNITPRLYLSYFIPITVRDCAVVGRCVLGEWTSLRAYPLIARLWARTWRKRQTIMRKRRATDDYMSSWFSLRPTSLPAPEVTAKCASLC